ncbi:hypothetical protein BDW75DRAFT_118390 [Aspergillus navahoensis]
MEKLNDDVLLLIGDYLEDHYDRYNAIFVNRRFYKLFSRALYRSASLKSRSQVQSFLKAITLRQSLASVVRSLDCAGWRSSSPQPRLTEEDIALFSLSAETNSYSREEHTQWVRDLCDGIDEAWIALLLSFVHNIRQLKLAYPHSLESRGYLDRLFVRATTHQKPFDRRPAFHRLHEASLRQRTRDDEDKGTMSPSQIMPFLRMPCLTTLAVDSLIEHRPEPADEPTDKEGEEARGPSAEGSQSQSFSEITLTSSNAFQGLESILSSCAALKSFKYQHTDALLLAEGFRPSAFNTSLSRHKSTLETMWLDNLGTHLPFTISGINESHEEWFGSFADFTALKDLRIRLPNLLDIQYSLEPQTPLIDILPGTIESLYIEDCKERLLGMLLGQVRSVLEARTRKTRFRALRRLDIEGFFHDDEEDADTSGGGNGGMVIKPRVYEMVEPLGGVCEEAGVKLSLRDRMCLHTMH